MLLVVAIEKAGATDKGIVLDAVTGEMIAMVWAEDGSLDFILLRSWTVAPPSY